MQVFLKSVMSVLERAFESNQDDVMSILKNLQVRMCFDDGFGGGGDTNCPTAVLGGFPTFCFILPRMPVGHFRPAMTRAATS